MSEPVPAAAWLQNSGHPCVMDHERTRSPVRVKVRVKVRVRITVRIRVTARVRVKVTG